MKRKHFVGLALAAALAIAPAFAQAPKGWKVRGDHSSDASDPDAAGSVKFVTSGSGFHATNPMAAIYWNPANTASGDYTVKATFLEPKFMALNSHPHSYGIFIGGNNLGAEQMSLVYCVAYGDGSALVRGFGPGVFTLLNTSPSASVHKAAGIGQPVAQEISWRVKGGRAECSINGAVVAGYDRAQLVGAGKLQSTDGVYGVRFTHNVEAVITGFSMTKG